MATALVTSRIAAPNPPKQGASIDDRPKIMRPMCGATRPINPMTPMKATIEATRRLDTVITKCGYGLHSLHAFGALISDSHQVEIHALLYNKGMQIAETAPRNQNAVPVEIARLPFPQHHYIALLFSSDIPQKLIEGLKR